MVECRLAVRMYGEDGQTFHTHHTHYSGAVSFLLLPAGDSLVNANRPLLVCRSLIICSLILIRPFRFWVIGKDCCVP